MSGVLSLRPSYYEALKRLTLELVGINLGANHPFLIETRLATLARKEGFDDLNTLIDELFSRGQSRLAIKVVSALLERDTHFNPDPTAVRQFSEWVVPRLMEHFPDTVLRVLSFGCSSGQEPLSFAIQLNKLRRKYPNIRFQVTGVDYPSPALDRAGRGQYTHFEVQRGLPIRDLVSYFDRRGEDWIVKPELRAMVTFVEHHLLSNLSDLGQFHVVVFRNGLMHYSSAAQVRVMRGLSTIVSPNGFLLLGSDEKSPQLSYGFREIDGLQGVLTKPVQPPLEVDELEATPVATSKPRQIQASAMGASAHRPAAPAQPIKKAPTNRGI